MMDPTELMWGLELAIIDRTTIHPTYVTGNLAKSGHSVEVSYIGRVPDNNRWLVVVDNYRGNKRIHFTSNLITSQNPGNILSLPSNQYVLYGLWEGNMRKSGMVPTFGEMNKYWNAGTIGRFLFTCGSAPSSWTIVHSDSFSPVDGETLEDALDEIHIKDITRLKPRLVVTDVEKEMGKIVAAIEKQGAIPVRIERRQ